MFRVELNGILAFKRGEGCPGVVGAHRSREIASSRTD